MGADSIILVMGFVCLAAAVVGGGFEAAGYKVPVISSIHRQILLGVIGVIMIFFGLVVLPGDGQGNQDTPLPPTPQGGWGDYGTCPPNVGQKPPTENCG